MSRWWLPRIAAVPLAVLLVGTASAPGLIRVRPGDSLWVIAERYDTTVTALKRLNQLPGDVIYAGSPLRIPGRATSARATRLVKLRVRRGDTVTGIAARHHVTIATVVAANRLGPHAVIRVGQILTIPLPSGCRTGTTPGRCATTAASRPGAGAAPLLRHYPAAVTRSAARHRAQLAHRHLPGKVTMRILIRRTALAVGLDPALALAVAQQESGFQQRVVSPADAIGVMQVLPSTGRWLSTSVAGRPLDLLDPADNVLAGVLLLKVLTRAAPTPAAVAGYYQGLASVRRNGMYPDTRRYVTNVLGLREHWR
jgi:LysM repeat protein